jgi:hypothetical protein
MAAPPARADVTKRIVPERIQPDWGIANPIETMGKEAESHGIE